MYFVIHSTIPSSNFESSNKTKRIMKKLIRIKSHESFLGGVLLGLAEYLDVDVTILRILTVAAFFSPVPIVILYLISWAIIPVKPQVHVINSY
jgi:phage shock protein C